MTIISSASPEQILKQARTRFSQAEIATICARDTRTVRRWENGEVQPPALIVPALREALATGKHADGEDFTFIDLFAGIGGIRLGFEAVGGKCVFTSEWNQWAVKTYTQNHGGEGHQFNEDITKIIEPKTEVPKHDVLLAGFPCQPFSIAGVSKKNSLGRPHGFECLTQGTLFYDVARVIAAHRPAAFLLENVKNLMSHDKGNTFRTIMDVLEGELKYKIHHKVIDGKHWTPQHRERIVIVGFRETAPFSWDALKYPEKTPLLRDILHKEDGSEIAPAHDGERFINANGKVQPKYVLTEHLWTYLQNYKKKHEAAGNGFGFGLVTPDQTTRTLSARYYKDGSEILISRGKGKRPRRLTPRECARLMGFPDSFEIPVSDTQAYKQFGNSVVVPVMRETARLMKPGIMAIKEQTKQPDLLAA